jgi:uncharacterized protein YciI
MKSIFLSLVFSLFLVVCYCQTNEKEYYFVFLNTNPDREELPEDKVMELQEGHMNNINRLAKEGKLISAGPVKGGGGIFVIKASSLEEAKDYLQTDPAIKARRFNLEVYPMDIIHGKLCSVSEEDFNMVSYTLIRYNGDIAIPEKNIILLHVNFKESDDAVLVLNYDLEKGSSEELLKYFEAEKLIYTKTLWIAKGSFCE